MTRRANIEGRHIKWTEFYKDEAELVADLRTVVIPEDDFPPHVGLCPLYTGYEYIHSFARRVQGGRELTEKQMTMAKRIAAEIKKAALIAHLY